jgi:hypothetical protein
MLVEHLMHGGDFIHLEEVTSSKLALLIANAVCALIL